MIGQDIVAALPELRAQAESMMLDTFTIHVPAGSILDADGMKVPAYVTQGTTVGKIQSRSTAGGDANTRTVDVGGVDRPVVDASLHIPVSASVPAFGSRGIGWEYELTTPGPSSPPEMVGSRWLVVDATAKSHMTARRLDVVRLP